MKDLINVLYGFLWTFILIGTCPIYCFWLIFFKPSDEQVNKCKSLNFIYKQIRYGIIR